MDTKVFFEETPEWQERHQRALKDAEELRTHDREMNKKMVFGGNFVPSDWYRSPHSA